MALWWLGAKLYPGVAAVWTDSAGINSCAPPHQREGWDKSPHQNQATAMLLTWFPPAGKGRRPWGFQAPSWCGCWDRGSMHPGVLASPTLAVTGMDVAQIPLVSPALQSPKLQLICQKDEQEGANPSPHGPNNTLGSSAFLAGLQYQPWTANPASWSSSCFFEVER